MKKILLSFLSIVAFTGTYAQGKLMKTNDAAVHQMESNRKTNAPFSVRFTDESNIRIVDIPNVFSKYLSIRTNVDELRLLRSDAGKDNIVVNRYQQYFKNIKVEHGSYTATAKNGKVAFINGDYFGIKENTSILPQLSESAALAKALQAVGAQKYKWQIADEEAFIKRENQNPKATYFPKGQLVFVEDFMKDEELSGKLFLAYKFDVFAHEPMSRDHIFVDATTGKILLRDAQIKHLNDEKAHAGKGKTETKNISNSTTLTSSPFATGIGDSRYSGSVSFPSQLSGANYILRADQATEGYPVRTRNVKNAVSATNAVEFTDNDNNWTAAEHNNATKDNVAIDAHWGATQVVEYWRTVHGRNSFDNNNATINSYVHWGTNYNNAGWNGSYMIYGDGSGTNGGFSPLTALDVCAHEIGHAICTYTSGLIYNRESGGMNEGFSDIWGAAVERFADPHETDAVPKSYFLIGEEIGLPTPNNPLRSMSNPKAFGQPDTYEGTYWKNTTVAGCPVPNSNTNDNCGVHYNSGVLNHWFYIMVQGKIGTNDKGFSYNVTGIGWDKTEKITYLAEQNLTPSSTYKAARTVFYNAAATLYGACSVEALTVLQAFDAVNVLGYDPLPTQVLTQNVTQQLEGSNVTYTTKISSLCPTLSISNFKLRDTLSANVTFVSATNGGTYDAGTRVVTYNVDIPGGQTKDYSVTVTINNGSYFAPVILFNDDVTTPIASSPWSTSSTTSNNWVTTTNKSYSAPNSYFTINTASVSDQRMFSTNSIALGATPPDLTFWNYFNTEFKYDGGIIEISTNDGATYSQIPASGITTGGYTSTMDNSTAIPGASAWTGDGTDWKKVTIPMTPYANQSVKLRFRFVTDNGTSAEGWYVDNIAIKNVATADVRSALYNPDNVRVSVLDTSTLILYSPIVCANVAVTTSPAAVVTCLNTNAGFTVVASGTNPTYQWQVSSDNGTTWTNITGAVTNTLSVSNVTLAMNNNQYRAVVSNSCPSTVNSAAATLTVTDVVKIATQPTGTAACVGTTATFNVTASGPGISYQWQVSTNAGTTWTNVAGATTATLSVPNVALTMNNYQYRVVLNGTCTVDLNSSAATLTVNTPVAITTNPVNVSICVGTDASFSVAATGTSITYQWQVSTNGGPFVNITNNNVYSGATTNTLNLTNLTTVFSGNKYRVVADGVPCGGVTSTSALLTVNPTPTVVLTAGSYQNYNPGLRSGMYATTSPIGTYSYQWFKNGSSITQSASSFNLTGDDFGEYYVIATNDKGCTHTSNKVTVADSASNTLFIYPNPTSGRFQVRYFNKGGATVTRKLRIFNDLGKEVYTKEYSITGAYGRMDVDLRNGTNGIYFVELVDANNKRVASGKVSISK